MFRVPDQRGWQPKGQLIDDHPGCSLTTCLHTDLDVPALAGEPDMLPTVLHQDILACVMVLPSLYLKAALCAGPHLP